MKERVSATIDKATKGKIKDIMEKGRYRNVSHVIEEAIGVLDKEVKNGRKK